MMNKAPVTPPLPPTKEKSPQRRFHAVPITLILIVVVTTTIIFINKNNLPFLTSSSESAPTRPEIIKGSIITLKRLKEEYYIDYHNMHSVTVRRAIEYPEHTTLDWTIRFLKGEQEKDAAGKVMLYCIFDNKTGKLIGSTEIREKNDKDPGQFSCWINEHYWGGGRTQEAIKLITAAYFKLTHEESFIAHVRTWNIRSYKALKKAGFIDTGFYYEDNEPSRYILEMRKK